MLNKATRVVIFWAIVFFVFVITPILGVSLYIYDNGYFASDRGNQSIQIF